MGKGKGEGQTKEQNMKESWSEVWPFLKALQSQAWLVLLRTIVLAQIYGALHLN